MRGSSVADGAFESVTKGVVSALDVNQSVLMGLVVLYFLCTPNHTVTLFLLKKAYSSVLCLQLPRHPLFPLKYIFNITSL